mmetsp:Transcript_9200/g.17523  ORF Transcript_9200/g.17523 Transcript_9200/m.17523 type:complete len:450 (-) Transcript_9200:1184-2533(-)
MNLLPMKADMDVTVSSEHTRRNASSRHSFTKSRRALPLSGPTAIKGSVSSSRVYKAPQALVRNDHYVNAKQGSHLVGTRRRRYHGKEAPNDSSTGLMVEAESDSSLGNVDELPAPPLWADDDDFPKISPYSRQKESAIPEIAWARSSGNHKHSSIQIRQGEDHSETSQFEDELFSAYETHLHTHLHTHDYTNRCCPSTGTKKRNTYWWSFSHPYANVIQLCALLLLAFLVFDSHHRVHKHKIQLQEYDEERAHILEQMMWIDQAAKKVHKKYTEQGKGPDSLIQMKGSDESARDALEKLQVRIQLNARDRLAQRFGDKPAEISLKINSHGEHLIVALSDDTPHAVSILLEQVQRRIWDDIRVEKASAVGAVQIASAKAATTPLLEFVEPSRGCHEIGSVAITQQEEDELHVLKLRVNLIANSPMEPGDVCIGRAVSSLGTLQEMATALS